MDVRTMIIQVVKRKAGSHKELGRQLMELPQVTTLRELLIQVATMTFEEQFAKKEITALSNEEISAGKLNGKIAFQSLYNDHSQSLSSAIATMLQDYEDGLFRVFLQGEECTGLDGDLRIQDNDELVFLRLIMLAGRLW